MLDIQSKKIVFQKLDAHKSNCRDIFCPLDVPDRLFSVGYDHMVNIFDTRKYSRNPAVNLRLNSPVTCVSAIPSSESFVVGTIKGEVFSYDIRNLKQILAFAKPHDSSVQRICVFSSKSSASSAIGNFSEGLASNIDLDEMMDEQIENNKNSSNLNASLMDEILDLQRRGRKSEYYSRYSIESVQTDRGSIGTRRSDDFGYKNAVALLNNLSFDKSGSEEDFDPNVSNINIDRLKKRQKSMQNNQSAIIEEEEPKNEIKDSEDPPSPPIPHDISDKFETPVQSIASSTPEIKTVLRKDSAESVDGLDRKYSTPRVSIIPKVIIEKPQVELPPNVLTREEFQKGMADLKEHMDRKSNEVHQLVLYDLERRYYSLLTDNFNYYNELNEKLEMLEKCVEILVKEDPMVEHLMQLQEENHQLTIRLEEMCRRFNN